jgi:tetratricopeptide (TPR) repeat protein
MSKRRSASNFAPKVIWLSRAKRRIEDGANLGARFDRELACVFGNASPIVVTDLLQGYRRNHGRKLILRVETPGVRSGSPYQILKLGDARAIRTEIAGYKNCIVDRCVTSRVLLPVRRMKASPTSSKRWAAIYLDAQAYAHGDAELLSLEEAARRAVFFDWPRYDSVESAVATLFTDLKGCLYFDARVDRIGVRTRPFYKKKIGGAASWWPPEDKAPGPRTVAGWVFGADIDPDAFHPASQLRYVDPIDYVLWAIENGKLPEASIGRAHGDLHGRNVIVMLRGDDRAGEPLVFDFERMGAGSVILWDFAKLESELKVRILPGLIDDPKSEGRLRRMWPDSLWSRIDRMRDVDETAFSTARETALAAAFELHLAEHLRAGSPPDADSPLGRALRLFWRIRRLSYELLRGAHDDARDPETAWREDYDFALAAYSLNAGPNRHFLYDPAGRICALVAGGMACARLHRAVHGILKAQSGRRGAAQPANRSSVFVPLLAARRHWRAGKFAPAMKLLREAAAAFPHALAVREQLSLCLLDRGRIEEAEATLAGRRVHFRTLGDEEALCRFGRVYKNMGDRALERHPPSTHQIPPDHPARIFYEAALEHYAAAHAVRDAYYSGINRAALLLMLGESERARDVAGDVMARCHREPDRNFWVLATTAEAALLSGRSAKETGELYRDAIALADKSEPRPLQSLWDQLCRIRWAAMGPNDEVRNAADIAAAILWKKAARLLRPGPLGNCGK